ncbi:ligase-associated DNA damage response endonuclease PdeM [Pedomonas sp. V897]|uniref:ligase-associated DNA damage response endonuclease PdeM n=1 Tax=Pedomonas sp. V897 TaxID=3446482 RepID=UPI003EE3862E
MTDPNAFTFHGDTFVALPDHALWWPRRRALLVADLHLEKASSYAQHGQFLPPYDSLQALAALEALVDRLEVQEFWCLGDSFHDLRAATRLLPEVRGRLQALTARLFWVWITGNHDPAVDALLGGVTMSEMRIDQFVLRHEADPTERRPELSGHFHPKLRLVVRGQAISRRCFALGEGRLILPAFGPLTGGLDVTDPAIARLIGPRGEALVATGAGLRRYPIGALSS